MRLSALSAQKATLYHGMVLPLEKRSASGYRLLSPEEVAGVLASVSRPPSASKVFVTDDISYALLYASGEMFSPHSSRNDALIEAVNNHILYVGVVYEFGYSGQLQPDPSQETDLGYSTGGALKHPGMTWASSLVTGEPQSFWLDKKQQSNLVLESVNVYPRIQYEGGQTEPINLRPISRVVEYIFNMPYWPEVIAETHNRSVRDKFADR